jgi:hypothetical protein
VANAVTTSASGATMNASFTPNFNLTLDEACQLCGYDHLNWHQIVTVDPYPPGGRSVPYVDPPPGGGAAFGGFADNLPFYWDEQGATTTGYHLSNHTTSTTVSYTDTPAESRLMPGQSIHFITTLAGVLPDGTWDALYAFQWSSNYNGTSGGVTTRRNIVGPDPGSGTGGIFDLMMDLNPEDIPRAVRAFMIAQGARNVPLNVVPEPGFLVHLLLVAMYWVVWNRGFPSTRRRQSG